MNEIITSVEILKQTSEPVTPEEAPKIIEALEGQLSKCDNGIGLGAIQLGIPKRVFVIKKAGRNGMEFDHFINPTFVDSSGEFIFVGEGCLSFPGLYLNTKRFHHYTIERDVLDGETFRRETDYFYYPETSDERISRDEAIGSIAVQHEMDHMEGKILLEYGLKNESFVRDNPKVGRNDPCPCGAMKNGKPVKYKKCCGKT